MAGRGFLKSRLAQMMAKEPDKSPEPENDNIPKAQIPVVSSENPITAVSPAVRGRRVIIIFSLKYII